MPLLDHFRPPLSSRRHWHSFHNSWATYLAADLNRQLPEGYFAEANVQFGIEIDVAAYEEPGTEPRAGEWTPPAPTATIPFAATTDVIEVQVYARAGGPRLAGAIELVSPRNKDRPAARSAFVSKCVSYISEAVGLLVVDVVTDRQSNLHAELVAQLGGEPIATEAPLYAVAYRLSARDGAQGVDVWHEPLAVGGALPTLPLYLPGGLVLALDLEASYERTRAEQRVPPLGA